MNPELHPALVHFPIALLLIGTALVWWEILRGARNQTADFILIVGFVGALAAAWSGNGAFARLILTPEGTSAAENHELWGTLAAWSAGASLAARWAILARARRRPFPRAWLAGGAVLWTVTVVLALGAGYRGGKLVHRMGITPAVVPLRQVPSSESFQGFHAAPPDSSSN